LYDDFLRVHSNTSKTSDNRTSAAFYVPEVELEAKLSNNLTTVAAELVAIMLGLDLVNSEQNIDRGKSVTVSRDILSAIDALILSRWAVEQI